MAGSGGERYEADEGGAAEGGQLAPTLRHEGVGKLGVELTPEEGRGDATLSAEKEHQDN